MTNVPRWWLQLVQSMVFVLCMTYKVILYVYAIKIWRVASTSFAVSVCCMRVLCCGNQDQLDAKTVHACMGLLHRSAVLIAIASQVSDGSKGHVRHYMTCIYSEPIESDMHAWDNPMGLRITLLFLQWWHTCSTQPCTCTCTLCCLQSSTCTSSRLLYYTRLTCRCCYVYQQAQCHGTQRNDTHACMQRLINTS